MPSIYDDAAQSMLDSAQRATSNATSAEQTQPIAPTPTAQPVNPYEAAADNMASNNASRLRTNAYGASESNPDNAARAKKIAQRTGGFTDAVERNLPQAQRDILARDVDEGTINSPTLRDSFFDPYFTKVAQDDVPALKGVEKAVRAFLGGNDQRKFNTYGGRAAQQVMSGKGFSERIQDVMRNNPSLDVDTARALAAQGVQIDNGSLIGVPQGAKPTIENILRGTFNMQGFAAQNAGLGVVAADLLKKFGLDINTEEALRKYQRAKFRAALSEPEFETVHGEAAYGIGKNIVQNAPGIALSIMGGSIIPGLAVAGASVQTESYGKYRDRGATPGEAALGSIAEGTAEIATEILPMGYAVKALGRVGMGRFLTGMIARDVPTEQAATLVQDAVDTAIANPNKTWAEFWQERPEAAYKTLVASVGMAAAFGGASHVVNKYGLRAAAAIEAEEKAEQLKAIFQIAAGSNLRGRDAETFAGFVQKVADEGEALSQVHIDADKLTKALDAAGIDMATFAQMSPDAARDLPDAISSGGSVAIPVGDLVGGLGDAGLDKALLPHLRVGENALSLEEAQQEQAAAQQYLQSGLQAVTEQAQQSSITEDSAARVRENLTGQLQATGRFSADVNSAYASIAGSFYTTLAEQLGVTPEQAYAAYPLKVQGAGQGELNQPRDGGGEARSLAGIARPEVIAAIDRALAAYKEAPAATVELSEQDREWATGKITPMLEAAAAAKPVFDNTINSIASSLGGEAKIPGLKKIDRAAEKLIRETDDGTGKPDPTQIRDLLRATVVVTQVQDVGKAIAAVRDKFQVVRVKNRFETPMVSGYRDVLINVRLPSGLEAEIQVNVPSMMKAKDVGHKLYSLTRSLADQTAVQELDDLQRQLYGDAFQNAMSSASAGEALSRNTSAGNSRDGLTANTSLPSASLSTGTPSTSNNSAPAGIENLGISNPPSVQSIADDTLAQDAFVRANDPQSPAFKKWFGDSKVVDADGKPLVVYHGTTGDFSAFDMSKVGANDHGWYGRGVYLSADPGTASAYTNYAGVKAGAKLSEQSAGGNVVPAYVSLQNPYTWPDGRAAATTVQERDALMAELKAAGYDGVIVPNKYQDEKYAGMHEVIAFEPNQIKSAIGNNGLFDAHDPDILHQSAYSAPDGPLVGLPDIVKVDGVATRFGPFQPARDAAASYMASAGREYNPPTNYVKVDPERATRIAQAFEDMAHNPNDPVVKVAYQAMIDETLQQWQAIKATGLTVEFIDGEDPYGNPRNAILDVVNNNHLWVFPTTAGFGGSAIDTQQVDVSGNPLMETVPYEMISGRPVQVNDIFRIVHDYFGHIKEGTGFRADGEENAWRGHWSMYSPEARKAMTSETRGQNSWVNFGPYAEFNKTANGGDTQYAPQKIGLLPDWVVNEGATDEEFKQSPFDAWFGDSKVVDADGKPRVVYHGTTNDFDTFDRSRSNIESDMGAGFYFSNTPDDVANNYAGEGPDLTLKIERIAERIEQERSDEGDDITHDEAVELARKQLSEHGGSTMPVYLSIKNPVVIGGGNETQFTYDEQYDGDNDSYSEPTGTLVDFFEALRNIDGEYGDFDVEAVIAGIYPEDGEGISASELIAKIKSSEDAMYATDYQRDDALASTEIIRKAFQGAGYDGVIDNTVDTKFGSQSESQRKFGKGMKGMEHGTTHYIAFKPNQIKSAIGNSGAFDPTNPSILAQGKGDRGSFSPKKLTITLLENADLSTFLHETGHFMLTAMADIASRPDAPARISEDMATILKWFNVPDLAAWNKQTVSEQRANHEKFAESFEQYLFEGKAPSRELQPMFQRFRSWMQRIYQSLQQFMAGHNTQLSDEVRAVFDRMLATDEQIARKNEELMFQQMFTTNEGGFMSDAEFADYMTANQMATGEAIDELQKRSLRDLKWVLNARSKELSKQAADVKKKRKVVEAEVRAEVKAEPVYAVQRWMKTGVNAEGEQQTGAKLHTEDLKAMFGEGPAAPWRYIATNMLTTSREDSLPPDTIAEMFGFTSGEKMVRDIVAAFPEDSTVQGITDNRMMERYGDISSPRAMEDAANAAVHNEYRAKAMATELKAMTQATQPARLLMAAARSFAEQLVGRKIVKQLRPRDYTSAETRAAKRVLEAQAKGDMQGAAVAKRDQVLQFYSAKEAARAVDDIKKAREFFGDIVTKKDDVIGKSRDMALVNTARAILANYGFGAKAKTAHEYLATVREHDPQTFDTIADRVMAAELGGKPFDQLTVDEVRALEDEIKSLWRLSKRTKQIEIDGRLMALDDAQQQLVDRLTDIGIPSRIPGEGHAVTPGEQRLTMMQTFVASLRRVESWVERKDGADNGPFRKLLFNTIKDGADNYRSDRNKYIRTYKTLLESVADSMTQGKIDAGELGYVFGFDTGGIGMAELLHAMLHTGNESNKRKLLLGRKWASENPDGTVDTSRWDSFVQRMIDEGRLTKKHFDFMQGVWDMLESTKPQAQKMHRDVFGKYFKEVDSAPFTTPFGSYRGGYVPAMTDPRVVADARTRQLMQEQNESMANAFPATNKGFTKSRVDYNQPLLLDLRTLSQHLDKVLLFSHLEGPVRDARRLMTGKSVAAALNRIDPTAFDSILTPWLNRAARQQVETPITGDAKLMRLFAAVRRNAGMAAMFANVSNAVQQLTGFSIAATKVPVPLLMQSIAQYIAHPAETTRTVAEASKFMADRMDNEVSAMHDAIEDILLDPSTFQRAQSWTRRHAYFMQAAVDNVMSPMVWLAAYNDALARGMTQEDARRHGDSVIRTTQGSTLPEDVSRIETGNAFVRMFTQFAGYFNMMANTNATELLKISDGIGLKKGAGKALYVLLIGALMPAWIAEAIAQAFKGGPDDEDDDGWYLDDWIKAVFGFGTLRTATAAIPGFGQAVNAAVNVWNKKPYDDRIGSAPAISMIESTVRSPKSVLEAIVADGNKQKAVRDLATAISILTGLPATALARPAGYLAGIADDKIEPTGPVDAARGAITGVASPQSK